MFNNRARGGILAAAAAYLGYLAYSLFQNRNNPDTTMAPWLAVLFAVLFVLAAVGLLIFAFRVWKSPDTDKQQDGEKDTGSLK